MELLIVLFVCFIAPAWLCHDLCKKKNRNTSKGIFVGVVFGWWAVLGLWLGLKTRDLNTKMLY